MGIGDTLGLPLPIVAGAVVSGSFFGDKLSPLSETTNLAAAITDTKLISHINGMMTTTIPAFIIALLFYMFLGFTFIPVQPKIEISDLLNLKGEIEAIHSMSYWLLLPPIIVLGLTLKQLPILVSLGFGCLSSIILAIIFQEISIIDILNSAYYGSSIETDNATLYQLLNRGGITSFFEFIFILSCATAFGGLMEVGRYPQVILIYIVKKFRTVRSILFASLLSTLGIIFLFGDTYLAIILPGKFFKDTFVEKGIDSKVLSRTIEDGGVSSPKNRTV